MIGAYDRLMRVLCVYPSFPKTYWGAELSLALTGKQSMLPPLGLVTVAALLPPSWPVRLADLCVRAVGDRTGGFWRARCGALRAASGARSASRSTPSTWFVSPRRRCCRGCAPASSRRAPPRVRHDREPPCAYRFSATARPCSRPPRGATELARSGSACCQTHAPPVAARYCALFSNRRRGSRPGGWGGAGRGERGEMGRSTGAASVSVNRSP
jgi:hypothetical protein